jgi:hypothetical protein
VPAASGAAAAAVAAALDTLLCSQPKKKVEKKYATKGGDLDDTPLDDPVLERLRKQRLEEEADMRCVLPW